MPYKQHPPYSIQVEFSEGCNLYCNFCGLRGIRKQDQKNFKFMNRRTAHRLAVQIADAGWNSRIEIAMHGEPTMNPDFLALIKILRLNTPNQIMMTSNGGGLLKDTVGRIHKMFEYGLNILALDWYEDVKICDKICARVEREFDDVVFHPEDPNSSPHARYPKSTKKIIFIRDISTATSGTHSTLVNHCGAAAPLDFSKAGKRCVKPFRELAVRWNGAIAGCCEDWRGVYKCGNLNKTPLKEIWNGPEFTALRRHLYHGIRESSPCLGCNRVGYRVGLLPDPLGKETLPRPNKRDREIFRQATRGRSLAVAIKREWE